MLRCRKGSFSRRATLRQWRWWWVSSGLGLELVKPSARRQIERHSQMGGKGVLSVKKGIVVLERQIMARTLSKTGLRMSVKQSVRGASLQLRCHIRRTQFWVAVLRKVLFCIALVGIALMRVGGPLKGRGGEQGAPMSCAFPSFLSRKYKAREMEMSPSKRSQSFLPKPRKTPVAAGTVGSHIHEWRR